MKKNIVFMLILSISLIFLLNGCQNLGTFCPSPGVCVYPEEMEEVEGIEEITGEIIVPPEEELEEIEEFPEEELEEIIEEFSEEADIVVTEGELVKLSPEAKDPEGNVIIFTFSEPLDENGEWLTETGDAGFYKTTIIASDGINEVSQEVTILVKEIANKAPVMEFIEDITITEGDIITIEPTVTDPEGDNIIISYSGWMTTSSYTTTYDDAGEYVVTIAASDGVNEVFQDVNVIVNEFNRPPVMEKIDDIVLKEGDPVAVLVDATDPDKDELTITYSEPLDEDGTWITEIGDAGTYEITVTLSDGINEVSQDFNIIVEAVNKPPVIEIEDPIEVDEGQTVILEPTITDEEGDTVEVTYSGWMTVPSYITTYDDAGEHIVTITASDGINEVSKDITVIVNDVNRPPEFTKPY